VTDDTRQSYWILLYNDFMQQTEPYRMRARLETLELALADRLKELKYSKDPHAESMQ
jgi:hypothetical protein